MRAQCNKYIMIDRIFFTAQNQLPNPYGVLASEYDVVTDTFRNISIGIISNSWCSAVRLPVMSGPQRTLNPIHRLPGPWCIRPCLIKRACTRSLPAHWHQQYTRARAQMAPKLWFAADQLCCCPAGRP